MIIKEIKKKKKLLWSHYLGQEWLSLIALYKIIGLSGRAKILSQANNGLLDCGLKFLSSTQYVLCPVYSTCALAVLQEL